MNSQVYQKVLFPFYEGFLRRRNTLKYLQKVEKNQWLPEDKIAEFQWIELKKLLKHAYENVPFYTEVFRQRNLTPDSIKSPDDFRMLPVIDKAIIKSNWDRMKAVNMPEILTKSTGGSTGEPLHFGYTRDSYEWRIAVKMRGYSWAGYREGDKAAFLWSVSVGNVSRISTFKSRLHHWIQNSKYFNIFELSPKTMEIYLREMKAYAPKHIISYGLGMYYLAKFASDIGCSAFPLKSIIIGAEKVQKDQIDVIESTFGCPVFNTYGCREFMLIASQCENRDELHINSENLFVEIAKGNQPVSKNEIGEVIITDLHNYGMPFIRYKNGDLAIAGGKSCSCGRGLPLMKDVEGRVIDTITTTDGKLITGIFFPHLMKEFREVEHFQVIQEEKGKLIVKIVPNTDISNTRLEYIGDEIRKVCGKDMAIDFQMVDEIPLTPSGKRRVTASQIPISF